MNEAVELLAKALWQASHTYEPRLGIDSWHVGWPAMAEAALAALETAGYEIVKRRTAADIVKAVRDRAALDD